MVNKKKIVLAAPVPLLSIEGKMNWDICCVCQEAGSELVCPAKNPVASQKNIGYNTFSTNVESLKGHGHIFPSGRRPEHFDEGSGIKETLIKNQAKWHKKCIVKYTSRFSLNPKTLTSDNMDEQQQTTSDVKTRSASLAINPKEEVCFLCKKKSLKNQPLHRCMTFEIFNSIKEYAAKANDTEILAFLAEGDLVAQEAKYHSVCVLSLHSKGKDPTIQQSNDDVTCESLAFADLLLYIHAQYEQIGTQCAFNTTTLLKLYNERLSQLLGKYQPLSEVHNSRFRERILLHYPDLQAIKSGREYVLTFKNANIVNNFDVSSNDIDALAVNRFVRNVRNNALSTDIEFSGNFAENCEENCIPSSLLALVNMILYGSSITSECRATKPAISISQLILANMLKSRPSGNIVKFKKTREPPLPLYMGLSLYGSSRNKMQIDNLHHRGISVSSNRIYELTADLARHVVQRAKEEGVVCPTVLQKGYFTVGAFDNIDVKPSSKTSQGEFHGSGISLFQLPLNGEVANVRTFRTTFEEAVESGSRHVPNLPDEYAQVPEFILKTSQPAPPKYSPDVCEAVIDLSRTDDLWYGEKDWLGHVHDLLTVEKETPIHESISWAAYRAVRQTNCPLGLSNNSLLPLFHEKSSSPAMVKHAMDVVKSTTEFLNPGQISVVCMDEPLFALAKVIQWNHVEEYGERKFVMLFGPLHIEQNFLRLLGDVMESSGWTGIVANSGILPSGSAEGLLKVSSITKSRLFHQYTAAVLHSLLKEAYVTDNPECNVTFEIWIKESAMKSPTFTFWLLVLRLELLLLKFVRSVREAQFTNFKEALTAMLPWFFSSSHHLYARWLTVHALDLLSLERNAPEVYRRFSMGAFVVRKTLNPFSLLGVDHAHEQNNAGIKSRGGALGLTQDPSALKRWTIAGPEVTRLLTEFEGQHKQMHGQHHEEYPKFQRQFMERCAALKESFLQSENPFLVKNSELITLDTRVEINEKGVESLNKLETHGVEMLTDFVVKRLQTHETPFFNPVKKEKIQIFTLKKPAKNSAATELKCDIQLFSRLFIISHARSLDLDQFFEYENQACPPSLSTNGNLRSGQKSQLVPILEKLAEDGLPSPETCDGIILDGAALVRMVKPREDTSTFLQFSAQVTNYCTNLSSKMKCNRVDIAWDQYNGESLKAATRTSRGTGARRPGLPEKGTFPKQQRQWDDYLKNDGNKAELFVYLAERTLQVKNLQVVTNVGDTIKLSSFISQGSALDNVNCAPMEEADGRIFLHAKDMIEHGCKRIMIRCSDTDIVVLAVSFFYEFKKIGLTELWVCFGVKENKRFVAAHSIALNLGEDSSIALRGFHAFSGCDSVSFFSGKGKKSAWAAWNRNNKEITTAFKVLGVPNKNPPDLILPDLEQFVVGLYGSKDTCRSARKHLFGTLAKPVHLIPPSLEVLRQHLRRAAYQAGEVWGRSTVKSWDDLPSPAGWGWKKVNREWIPHWSDQEDIWRNLKDVSTCGCTTGCGTKRCSCLKYGVCCTLSCRKCKGTCENRKKDVLPESDDDVDGDLQTME